MFRASLIIETMTAALTCICVYFDS